MSLASYHLENIIRIKHGFAFKGEYFSFEPNENILVTPGNFNIGGGFKSGKLKYYNGPLQKDYILTSGDLIVTMTDLSKEADTLGFAAKVPDDKHHNYLHNQRIGLVKKIDQNFDSGFLYWLMRSEAYQKFIAGSATGATVKHTSPTKIYAFKFKAPKEKIEQKKISSILFAYDDLIENNLQRIKLLEETAQITYEEWFVRMKFPGHEKASIDPETGLPHGWCSLTLADVTVYINRGITPKYVEEKGFPVLNQKCIRDNYVNFKDSRLTSCEKKISPDKLLKPLDILVNSTGAGTLGRVGQVFDCPERVTVDSHVTIIRASQDISPYYLGRHLEAMESFIESLGKGATNQQELGRSELAKSVMVNVPTSDLSAEFDQLCKPVYETCSALRNQNQLLKEARDILLPRLMTGMIDIDKVELPEALLARS